MTLANRLRIAPVRVFGSIALVAAVAAAVPVLMPSRALAADKQPLTDQKEAAPTTAPAAEAGPKVDAAAQKELDQVSDAYKKLSSLHVAGALNADIEVGDEKKLQHAAFEASFQAPTLFHQSVREGEAGKEKETLVVGNTGEKLYVFNPAEKYYLSTDGPKARTTADKLGKPFNILLERQNPALMLAMSEDPTAELLEGVKSATMDDAEKVGGESYSAIKMTRKDGSLLTILVDPKTHLIRRMTYDMKPSMDPKGTAEVKKALVTVDYTTVEPAATVKPEQFAWKPPEGAKDVSAAAQGGEQEAAPAMQLEGKAAPDFSLKGVDGKPVALADLKGKVIVLDFWATWCGPCRQSLPHLNELYDSKKADGLKVFAVNLREGPKQVEKFATQSKLTIPVLFDSDGAVAQEYGVTGIPQTVVIGKDGNVKKIFIGSGTHEEIRKTVEEAMK